LLSQHENKALHKNEHMPYVFYENSGVRQAGGPNPLILKNLIKSIIEKLYGPPPTLIATMK